MRFVLQCVLFYSAFCAAQLQAAIAARLNSKRETFWGWWRRHSNPAVDSLPPLRRVVRVDLDVVIAEIAAPGDPVAWAMAHFDRDRHRVVFEIVACRRLLEVP